MALHTELPIFAAAYTLTDLSIEIWKEMPRVYKEIGKELRVECIGLTVLIFRANVARDKAPHLETLVERLQVIELTLRFCVDKRLAGRKQYAEAVKLTQSIGRQATGWRKKSAAAPVT